MSRTLGRRKCDRATLYGRERVPDGPAGRRRITPETGARQCGQRSGGYVAHSVGRSSFLSSLRARGRKRGTVRRGEPRFARTYLPNSFAFRGSCPRQQQLTAAPQHRQNRLYHHHRRHFHYRRRIRSFNVNTDATEGLLALG